MSHLSKWPNRKHRRRLSIRRSGARNILFGRFGTDEKKRETSRRESETESIFLRSFILYVLKVDKKTSILCISLIVQIQVSFFSPGGGVGQA